MGLPFPSIPPSLTLSPGQPQGGGSPPTAAPLPTRDPQRPSSRDEPLNLGAVNDSPTVRRQLDYLRGNPAYQEYFRNYERAIRDGTPLPEPPQIELPAQNTNRSPTFPTLEAAREARPASPPRNPMPRVYMRGANEAGRMPDEIRLSLPGQPAPAPANPTPPRRPAPLPWQQPVGSTGRRVGTLDVIVNPEQTRLSDYVATHPQTQQYLRDYERAIREGRPTPPQPILPPMPDDYQPRQSYPRSTADIPTTPNPRPARTPFPAPATRPSNTPNLPTAHRPATPPPRSTSPRPATNTTPRPAPPASNPAPARTAPTPGRAPRNRGRAQGRSPLSRMPIPLPFAIPDLAPERPIFPNNPIPSYLPPGMNVADQLIRWGGENLEEHPLLAYVPIFGPAIVGDNLARRMWPRRPAGSPQNFPVPEIATPDLREYDYLILQRQVRSNPQGSFTTLNTRVPAQGNFEGLVTLSRSFRILSTAPDGDYNWVDELIWSDAVRSGTAIIYSGVIQGDSQNTPSDYYQNVRTIPYIIPPGATAPTQLPDWNPTTTPTPTPIPTNPFSPYPAPASTPAPSPPAVPFTPVIPAITPVMPGFPSAQPRPPGGRPTGSGSGRPSGNPITNGPTWANTSATAPSSSIFQQPGIPFLPTGGDTLTCRFRDDPYSQAIRNDTIAANQKLDQLLGLIGDAGILARINSFESNMNGRLGPQMSGGISGVLRNFTKLNLIQSFLNALTFLAALHNAFMLSNNLRLTLFSAFDLIYELPGMARFAPTDPETGERVDYGTWAGDQFDELLRNAFGDHTVDTVRTTWNKASRVYQAAANMLFALQSIMWSIQEALEVVGNYVAKIGNAARKFGVVAENAYGWMNPNAADSRRFSRFYNFMNQASEQVENIEQVAAATLDITESAAELQRQSVEFGRALQGITENGDPDPAFPPIYPYDSQPPTQPIEIIEGTQAGRAQDEENPIPPETEQRVITDD